MSPQTDKPAKASPGPVLSVVICAFAKTPPDVVTRTCDAVLEQLAPRDEIVLVVDYSVELRETLQEHFRATAEDRVRVISNRDSPGLSGARNSAIVVSGGEVIAFVDDDAVVSDNWVERLLTHYRDPDVVGVAGLAVPDWTGPRPGWLPEQYFWIVGCNYSGLPTGVSEVRNFVGCNLSFRRSVFETVGGFLTSIKRRRQREGECAETELCIRLQHAVPGAKLLFDPEFVVKHPVDQRRATVKLFRQRCFGYGYSQRRLARLARAEGAHTSDRAFASEVLSAAFLRSEGDADAASSVGTSRNRFVRETLTVFGLLTTGAGYLFERLNGIAIWRRRRALVAPSIVRIPGNVRLLRDPHTLAARTRSPRRPR